MSRVSARIIVTLLTTVMAFLAMASGATAHQFGNEPYDDVLDEAGKVTLCSGLTRQKLAAMMFAPTWPETGAGTAAPSPMALSRGDVDTRLYSFDTVEDQVRAFWHPGVGMWMFDEAGGTGASMTANQRISSASSAVKAAELMASGYCNSSGTGEQRRAAAWGPWHACNSGMCEQLFREHWCSYNGTVCNITRTASVSRWGGMEKHTCRYTGSTTTFTCWYVNPVYAQGALGYWQQDPKTGNYSGGLSPLSFAFYVYLRQADNKELRHWIETDTTFSIGEISARRPMGQNSRGGLSWVDQDILCDATGNRGSC